MPLAKLRVPNTEQSVSSPITVTDSEHHHKSGGSYNREAPAEEIKYV
jgi:hypothetical protein